MAGLNIMQTWRTAIGAAMIVAGALIFDQVFNFSYVGPGAGVVRQLVAPEPYTNVIVREQYIEGEWLYFTATFDKSENCVKEKFAIIGTVLGIPEFIEFEDLDGLPINDNRTAGAQTLRIRLDGWEGSSLIEIRTRHNCGGIVVDKVFAVIDPTVIVERGYPVPAEQQTILHPYN